MYDIYTPMIADVAKKISFEEAKETVLKALAPLGEDYVNKVKEGFENRWIDVYENQGKRSGAYSAGAYGCQDNGSKDMHALFCRLYFSTDIPSEESHCR